MLNSATAYRLDIETKSHLSNINAYYDSPAVQLFEAFSRTQIHLGYWDDKYPNVTLEQAAMRLTQVIIDYIGTPRDGLFLDIGCGCGLPSIEIAKQKHCYVEGVTINEQQKLKADNLARTSKQDHRVNFNLADATALPFESESFHGALLLESIHHIGHYQALNEAYRVLKKGGEIIIADGAAIQASANSDERDRLAEIFVSKSLVTPKQLKELMNDTGFEVTDTLDLTQAVLPTWQKLIEETKRNEHKITATEGSEFYRNLMVFWYDMKDLWHANAKYLLYKGIKR